MRSLIFLLAATLAAAVKPPARFVEHTIATDLKGGYHVVAADLNKDGKPDLIALASGMKDLVWFEAPSWERHVLATGFSRMINAAAYDVDGDGIPEIAMAYEFSNIAKDSMGVVCVLEHSGDARQPWRVREIDRLTTSHRLRWADVDGSGKKVLINAPLTGAAALPPLFRGKTPLVLYRPGEWKRELIGDENEGVAHGVFVTDWDGDRQDEILTASFVGIHLYKFAKTGRWTRTELTKGDPAPWPKCGASDVAAGRLGRRRFLASIEPWHGNQVVVYPEKDKRFTRIVLDDKLIDGHTVEAADLNGDRIDEVIAGYRGKGGSVYIYYSQDGKGVRWSKTVLDNGGIGAASCTVADLNQDALPDVACIGSSTSNLKWYENRGLR